jgi:WD40 repeat protein
MRADFHDLAFRADGLEFYSWHQDGLLRVHETATGKVLRAFLLPGQAGVRFSADGRFLTLAVDRDVAQVGAKALTVWDTRTGTLRYRIKAPAGDLFSSWDAALHDGRTLVTGERRSGAVRLWDVTRGTSRLLREKAREVIYLVSSPDGKRLFVQTADSSQCWASADGKELWRVAVKVDDKKDELWVCPDLMVAPDGSALLVGEGLGGALVQILDAATGKPYPKLRLPPRELGTAMWGVDGRTLLIQDPNANVVHIWDLEAGKERSRLPWGYGCIAPSPDGKTLLGNDPQLQRWDLRTGKPLYPSMADHGHPCQVEDMACSPDGKLLVSGDRDGSVFFWDLQTGRPLRIVRFNGCVCLAFTPDGSQLIIGTYDETLAVCDPTSGKVVKRLRLENLREGFGGLHRGPLYPCEGERLLLNRHQAALSVRAWSRGPGGVTAAWDLKTGKHLWLRVAKGTEGLSGLSADGRWGVAWDLSLREVETGRLVGRLAEKDGQAANHRTVFSPDGSLIATNASHLFGSEKTSNWEYSGIEIWERATCRLVRRFPVEGWLRSFGFSPDGRRLAALYGDEFWVWDVARGKELLHRKATGDGAYWRGDRLTFTPSGKALAVATEDGSILLWEIPPVAPAALPVLGDDEVRRAWKDLGAGNPGKAFAAVADLADRPAQGIALLKEQLRAAAPASAEEVHRLIADLDNEVFATREVAERKLAVLGPRVWPALREVLSRRPSAEARRRLERLLDEQRLPAEDDLRSQRAARVLEWVGTTQAQEVLRILAAGDANASLTQEAKAALGRLGRRLAAEEWPRR